MAYVRGLLNGTPLLKKFIERDSRGPLWVTSGGLGRHCSSIS
jgi:hypothetical protein